MALPGLQKGSALLITLVVIIVVWALGMVGFIFWHSIVNSSKSEAGNYEQCAVLPGSRILETYPQQCVTSGGQTFTNTR